jgi:hypothetical protein
MCTPGAKSHKSAVDIHFIQNRLELDWKIPWLFSGNPNEKGLNLDQQG